MNESTNIILISATALLALLLILLAFMLAASERSVRRLKKSIDEGAKNAVRAEASSQAGFNALAGMLGDAGLRSEQQFENLRASVDRRLAGMQEGSEDKIDRLRLVVDTRLDSMQKDNAANLEKVRLTVDEKLQQSLDEKLSLSFASVRKSLEEVYKGLGEMQGLAQGVGDLKKVLSNVKTRGIVGEIQLGAILSQIMAPSQYLENAAVKPGSQERVEYAVRLPGDGHNEILLPIDAKFHGDSYALLMDAYESADKALFLEARKQLASAIKKSAKDICDKYIAPPYTTDFAVMFLPFEGLYAEAINLGLLEIAQRDYHVMIAGPSTVSALLNSLQLGFKTIAIQQNAGKVWTVLGRVKSEFDKFSSVLASAQNKITQAGSELDKLVGTRTRMIQRTLQEVQGLDENLDDSYIEFLEDES